MFLYFQTNGVPETQATEGRLPKPHRPDQVEQWTKRARKLDWDPKIADLAEYKKTWYKWYASLMPASRHTPKNWPLARDVRPDETWPILMQTGPNGLTILMITLYWWSRAVGGLDSDLEFVLKDVAWVFKTMLASEVLVAVKTRDEGALSLLSPSKVLTTNSYHIVVGTSSSRTRTRSSKQGIPPPVNESGKENDPCADLSIRKRSSKRART